MTATPSELYNEFLRIADSGDETAAREFLSKRLADFPQETQDEIVFAFMEEAILKRAEAIADNAALQKEGIDSIDQLEKAKKDLENDARIDELKGSLDAK